MRYRVSFNGRTKHAIGIFYAIDTEADGDTPLQAFASLYDRFDHIQQVSMYELGEHGARRLVPASEYGRGER